MGEERNENFCDKDLWTTKREIHASFLCTEDGGGTTADKSKNYVRLCVLVLSEHSGYVYFG
jgi:hypothetical protein